MNSEEIKRQARAVIAREAAAIAALADQIDDTFVRATELLLNCPGHVIVAGSGTSHTIAARMAHLLSCSGVPALFLHPGDTQHGSAGALKAGDVLIAISRGGETNEVNHLAGIARKRGATVIGLTARPDSSMARLSDLVLVVTVPEDVDPYGMISTGSSLGNAAYGDALATVLLHLTGYSREAFGETHPGGIVGKMLAEEEEGQ